MRRDPCDPRLRRIVADGAPPPLLSVVRVLHLRLQSEWFLCRTLLAEVANARTRSCVRDSFFFTAYCGGGARDAVTIPCADPEQHFLPVEYEQTVERRRWWCLTR